MWCMERDVRWIVNAKRQSCHQELQLCQYVNHGVFTQRIQYIQDQLDDVENLSQYANFGVFYRVALNNVIDEMLKIL